MEKFKEFVKEYGIRIAVIFLSMLFLCTYISRKEGYHMDEILAYQLANAEYNPWIVPTQPVGRLAKFMGEHIDGESLGETVSNFVYIIKDTLANRGNSILANYKADVYDAPVWISGEMYRDYLQCESGDDFNLFSVYFNVKDDNHPPLHFMLLHMMTSIFKGEISVWHGCVINLAAIAGTLWLLGLIGDLIFEKKSSGIALMVLYGFSTGAVGTAIWIRMYGLLTLWTAWILYLHIKHYAEESGFMRVRAKTGKAAWIGSYGIFVVTVLSFWTQYFGLFFIIPLAAVTVVLLAKAKRLQELWAYVQTMGTAAVVGVGVYPFAIGDVLFSSRGTEALGQWRNGFGEFVFRLKEFGNILGTNVVGRGWILCLALLIPAVALLWKKTTGKWWHLAMIAIPTGVYFLLAAKMSPYFVDRYIMALFPVTALLLIWLWDRQPVSVLGIVLALVVFQNVQMEGRHEYLYEGYEGQLAIAESYAEYPCVCLYPGLSFYENVMEMERFQQTILLKSEELALMDESRTEVTAEGYVALIKYPGEEAGKGQLAQIMQVFGGKQAELLYEGGAYGDVLYLVTP